MSFQEFADAPKRRIQLGRMSRPVLLGSAALVVVCIAATLLLLSHASSSAFQIEKADASVEAVASESEAGDAPPAPSEVYVHVAGCVVRPGICKLEEGARVAEAIEGAGGFTEDAAIESVNLARVVEDGEQIVVASQRAVEEAATQESMSTMGASAAGATATGGRININTASEADLQTISGIGPSKAAKIIAYRESNGAFKTVDDLCNVSGIGQKTLESIRDQICV